MRDKIVVLVTLLVGLLLVGMPIGAVMAWYYPDKPEDTLFETWGPRIDRILIKKYDGVDAMLTALQGGEIDITDWPLTKTWMDIFANDPNIVIMGYGGEAGYYTINFNHNPNQYLGNPPNETYPNPVYPNPTSELALRQALSHCVDRVYLAGVIGEGLYDPIFTPVPAYMTGWIHPDIRYGGALEDLAYPPSIGRAAEILDAGGFPLKPDGSSRYWDRNRNGQYDDGEDFLLKFYSRADKLRKGAADLLEQGLIALKIPYMRQEISGLQAQEIVMREKNYNIYTAGWIFIGPDPDYLYDLYHSSSYYHPEDCPNFGFINDTQLDDYAEGIKYATNNTEALDNTLAFQERFAEIAAEIPLASTSAPKAFFRYYTGGTKGQPISPDDGENKYRGKPWTHIVNQRGIGENSWYTTLNAYPEGYLMGDGQYMTMRYGWKELGMPETLNPLYSSWYWEWEVLGRMYDSCAGRNPYTLGPFEVEFLADTWEIGTYVDPEDGKVKSNATIYLRSDILWSDGVKFNASDVAYTFVELPQELAAKGAPDVWWQPTIDQMKSFRIIDEFTVEVKMKVQSVWAIGWVLGNIIVPKHVLSPFITDPETTAFDITADWWSTRRELLVGTGPFLLVDVTDVSLLMVKNPLYYAQTPGTDADINYDHIVDIYDIVLVAVAFGAVPGDPNWNARADINKDRIIDIYDIVIVALAFGYTY